jgi:hypothetical protein
MTVLDIRESRFTRADCARLAGWLMNPDSPCPVKIEEDLLQNLAEDLANGAAREAFIWYLYREMRQAFAALMDFYQGLGDIDLSPDDQYRLREIEKKAVRLREAVITSRIEEKVQSRVGDALFMHEFYTPPENRQASDPRHVVPPRRPAPQPQPPETRYQYFASTPASVPTPYTIQWADENATMTPTADSRSFRDMRNASPSAEQIRRMQSLMRDTNTTLIEEEPDQDVEGDDDADQDEPIF